MRKVYLSNITREAALKSFLGAVSIDTGTEVIKAANAAGRVTTGPVFAELSMPGYHAAAMDGVAVRAGDTFAASDQNPVALAEGAGFCYVDTGNALPDGFDAVIKIEDIQPLKNGSVEILAPATPWQHIRSVGEDVVAGEMIVTGYHRLRPADLGALLAGGVTDVEVLKVARVAIIPTGSEIVDAGAERGKGAVPDFNSTVVAAFLQDWGAEPVLFPIVSDVRSLIIEAVSRAVSECDAVIVLAGSSAGRKDFTASVIEELGEVFLHGIASRPGKPTILGAINGKPVVGLPGYPVSAYLSLEWFMRPLIYGQRKEAVPQREKQTVTLGRRVVSEIGTEEHVRMSVGYIDSRFIANPLTRGAGVTTSLVRADGLLIIPPESVGLEQDSETEIELYRPASLLRNNLLAAGSHDLVVDMLANDLKESFPKYTISSAHLGSMGGINAIGKGHAHFAGIHLFDPESGDYNAPYIRRYLPDRDMVLITLTHRMQGWFVPKGNPDGIKQIEDLSGDTVGFVNRQRGAGTRLLFDYLLKEAGLEPGAIYGYEREEHTHLNVAAAVAAGTARVGLGILPAAKAFELDFVPVAEERYDILMSGDFYRSDSGKAILEVIHIPAFRKKVEALDGYSMRESGRVVELKM